MQDFINNFIAAVDGGKTFTFIILFSLDFIAGVIVAIKERTFIYSKLANFLNTTVVATVAGYYLLGVMVTIEPSWKPWLVASFAAIVVSLVASIGSKLKKLGIQIPGSISKFTGKIGIR